MQAAPAKANMAIAEPPYPNAHQTESFELLKSLPCIANTVHTNEIMETLRQAIFEICC